MNQIARWHVWLGWIVAVPLLFWTVSGLWMVARPIEEVRGTTLRAESATLPPGFVAVMPSLDGQAVTHITLLPRIDRPVWVIHRSGGALSAVDASNGAPMPRIDDALARRVADAALLRPAAIRHVAAFAAVDAPVDLRKDRPSWQVAYADGLHVYVDAVTGEVLAVRSAQWRAFDLMWGLHIMDLQGREDTSHPLLIGLAALALLTVLLGNMLLFRRRKRQTKAMDGKSFPED